MTTVFAWICAGIAAIATLAAAYFFDKSAEEGIAHAGEKAAHANQLAAQAHERAAALEKETEKERLARVKLEAELAPRRLSANQQAAIAAALKPFANAFVILDSYGLDAESGVLGLQIQEAISKTPLRVHSTLMTRASGGSIALGVQVHGSNQALVDALVKAFADAGLVAAAGNPFPGGGVSIGVAMPPPGPIDGNIFVGVKPIAR